MTEFQAYTKIFHTLDSARRVLGTDTDISIEDLKNDLQNLKKIDFKSTFGQMAEKYAKPPLTLFYTKNNFSFISGTVIMGHLEPSGHHYNVSTLTISQAVMKTFEMDIITAVMPILLQKGFNINSKYDVDYKTGEKSVPLLYDALISQKTDAARYLLSLGARVYKNMLELDSDIKDLLTLHCNAVKEKKVLSRIKFESKTITHKL